MSVLPIGDTFQHRKIFMLNLFGVVMLCNVQILNISA